MSWSRLTYEQRKTIAEKYRRGESLTEDAHRTGISPGTLGRNARTFLSNEAARRLSLAQSVQIPPAQPETYNQALHIEADNAIVISDLELPDHDEKFVLAALLAGLQYDINTLVIAGDLIATDMPSLTDWQSTHSPENQASFRSVIKTTRLLLSECRKVFQHIYFFRGNHDDRLARKTGGELDLDLLLDSGQVVYSWYRYAWLKTSRGYYYLSHPQNYSGNSVALGQRLYNTHTAPDGTKPHIVLAHTHQAQTGFSPDGQRRIFALGCMRDKTKTRYKATASNTMPEWSQSFLVIRHGYGEMLYPDDTDWKTVVPDYVSLLSD